MSPEGPSVGTGTAAELASRRRSSSSSGVQPPPPPPGPPPPRAPPPPVTGRDVRNAREVELDALRQKGLAKIFNRHFTTVTESIAREREAADMALKELEKRRDTVPRRPGTPDAAATQTVTGENAIIDRVYSELQRRKDEVKRKERETMELYRKYVTRYGGPGAAANFAGAVVSPGGAAPPESSPLPQPPQASRRVSQNAAVDADAVRQADVLLARMRERSSISSGQSQEGADDAGNTTNNVSSMARRWENASAGQISPSLPITSPGSRSRGKFSLPATSKLTPPPVMASSDDGSHDNSDTQAGGSRSRIKFANLDEVLETSIHPEDEDADSAASTPTRSSSKRVLSKSAYIERSMEDGGDDTPTTTGDSVAAVDPEAILSQIPGGADGIDEESNIVRAARRNHEGGSGGEEDDDSVLSGISSIATRTVIMTEAEQRLAEFLRIETDNIRRLLDAPDEDPTRSPASGSAGNGDAASTGGAGSVSSGDTTRAAEDAARIAEEMARTMAETAAGWVDGTVATSALADDDDAAGGETWFAYWDAAQKREYYFEPESGQVTWDRPTDKKIDDSTLEKPRDANIDLDDADRVEVKDFSAKKSVSLEESTVDPRNVTLEQAIEEFRPDSDVISYRSMISHASSDSGTRKSSSLQEYRERRARAALRRRKRKLRRLFAGAAVGVAGAVCVYHYRDRLWPGEDPDSLTNANATDRELGNVTDTIADQTEENEISASTDQGADEHDVHVSAGTGCIAVEGSDGCHENQRGSESFVSMTDELVRKVVEDPVSDVTAPSEASDSESELDYFDVSEMADDSSQLSSMYEGSETGSLHTAVENVDEDEDDDVSISGSSKRDLNQEDPNDVESRNADEQLDARHIRGYGNKKTMITSDSEKIEQVVYRLDESRSKAQREDLSSIAASETRVKPTSDKSTSNDVMDSGDDVDATEVENGSGTTDANAAVEEAVSERNDVAESELEGSQENSVRETRIREHEAESNLYARDGGEKKPEEIADDAYERRHDEDFETEEEKVVLTREANSHHQNEVSSPGDEGGPHQEDSAAGVVDNAKAEEAAEGHGVIASDGEEDPSASEGDSVNAAKAEVDAVAIEGDGVNAEEAEEDPSTVEGNGVIGEDESGGDIELSRLNFDKTRPNQEESQTEETPTLIERDAEDDRSAPDGDDVVGDSRVGDEAEDGSVAAAVGDDGSMRTISSEEAASAAVEEGANILDLADVAERELPSMTIGKSTEEEQESVTSLSIESSDDGVDDSENVDGVKEEYHDAAGEVTEKGTDVKSSPSAQEVSPEDDLHHDDGSVPSVEPNGLVDEQADISYTSKGLETVAESRDEITDIPDAGGVMSTEGTKIENHADGHGVDRSDVACETDPSTDEDHHEVTTPLPTGITDQDDFFEDAESDLDGVLDEPSGFAGTPASDSDDEDWVSAENTDVSRSKARSVAVAEDGQGEGAVSPLAADSTKWTGAFTDDGNATPTPKPLYCRIPLAFLFSAKCRRKPSNQMPPMDSSTVDAPASLRDEHHSTGADVAPVSPASESTGNLPVLAGKRAGVCNIPFAYLFNKKCRQQPFFDAENFVTEMFQ